MLGEKQRAQIMSIELIADEVERLLGQAPASRVVSVWRDGAVTSCCTHSADPAPGARLGPPALTFRRGRMTRLRIIEKLRGTLASAGPSTWPN